MTEPAFSMETRDLRYRPTTLDRVVVQRRLEAALSRVAPTLSGRLLDIGCGRKPFWALVQRLSMVNEYVGVDIQSSFYPAGADAFWDGRSLPFASRSFDCALLTEVLEHCPDPSVVVAEAARIMKPMGTIVVTVPFLWPLHDVPYDEYRYTPFALERILRDAGFGEIDIQPLGGWDASVAQLLGLWSRRRLGGWKRTVASAALLPVVVLLNERDRSPSAFRNSLMFTGLVATARRH